MSSKTPDSFESLTPLNRSLQKDERQITHDPFPLRLGDIPMRVDLGAETLLAAKRGQRKIAVEIESFTQLSVRRLFHGSTDSE